MIIRNLEEYLATVHVVETSFTDELKVALNNSDEVDFFEAKAESLHDILFFEIVKACKSIQNERLKRIFRELSKKVIGVRLVECGAALIFQGDDIGYSIMAKALEHSTDEEQFQIALELLEALISVHTNTSLEELKKYERHPKLTEQQRAEALGAILDWDQIDSGKFF
jgi:hypothetical protein